MIDLRHSYTLRRYVGRKRILIRFGALEREVIVKPGSELITVEIHPLLSLEQQVCAAARIAPHCSAVVFLSWLVRLHCSQGALDMRYLRDIESGATIEFVREGGSPYKSIQNERLANFGVYDVIVSDLRAARLASLPPEVVDNVTREFAEFDPHGQVRGLGHFFFA